MLFKKNRPRDDAFSGKQNWENRGFVFTPVVWNCRTTSSRPKTLRIGRQPSAQMRQTKITVGYTLNETTINGFADRDR
jgi:hypothetical protein